MDGEPEDRFLCRDFNDCYMIPELLNFAFECGKADETVTIVRKEDDE